MEPERWQQIESLFYAALACPPPERQRLLDQTCSRDAALRQEVESLIAAHDQAGSMISSPAVQRAAPLIAEDKSASLIQAALGPYRVLCPLGSGGMGDVYLAYDTRLGRRIALKLLPARFTADEERVRRFRQEARAASSLNHPNIITIHDIGEVDGRHYMATEFVEGKTVRQLIASGAISLSRSLDIAIQVAGALSVAHQAAIVHRDLKPENVMVRGDGIVKVLDFGLAKLTEWIAPVHTEAATLALVDTDPGLVLGTISYMSPEQARGEAADPRSDIFSLGVVIYEMVTGGLPFKGESMVEVLYSVIHDEPPPLSESCPGAPATLERIVNRTLGKAPQDRYQAVGDLRADLAELKDELELTAEPRRGGLLSRRAGARSRWAEHRLSAKHRVGYASLALLLLAGIAGYLLLGDHKAIESIAVMPFANESGDQGLEYLSDGITESIISNLSQLPNLKVMSRNTAFHYKGREIDAQSVGRDLKVRALLTGRVTQRGDLLAFSIELVDARDGSQLWGDRYTRKLSDMLSLQSEISQTVSEKLRLRLTGDQRRSLARSYTSNSEAYQLYLKGRYHWAKRTRQEFDKAIELFGKAIELDPKYALAYCGLSDSWDRRGLGGDIPPREVWQKAKEAASRAIELDAGLAESHTSLAIVKMDYDWDFVGAESEFKRALELNPDYATAHLYYAGLMALMKRFDEAFAENRRGLQIDPLSIFGDHSLGYFYLADRQYDQAIDQLKKTLELDPNLKGTHLLLSHIYAGQRMYEEAMTELRASYLDLPGNKSAELAYLQSVTGKADEARKALDALKQLSKHQYVTPYSIAAVCSGLGDKDQCFEWLEKAYSDHDPNMLLNLRGDPRLDSVRGDSRFEDLLRRMGLPE
jgi:serine/threonine protein kinase/lipoprotein NlpI